MLFGYGGLGFAQGFAPIFLGSLLVALAMGCMPSLSDALTLAETRRVEAAGLGRIIYGHIRVWTSVGVLTMMLLSGRIVALFPGERIIFALLLVTALAAAIAILAALKFKRVRLHRSLEGRLTADRARLRLALVGILAAALIQASHAEIYSFATLNWRRAGLTADFISAAWAIGVACEGLLFAVAARVFRTEENAAAFIILGGIGAALRWLMMSGDSGPGLLLALQAMHGLSFAATYCGSVLLLGGLAGPTHRARMQGWLAAASALSLALATLACGPLTSHYGAKAYLAMTGLALAGLGLAFLAAVLKRRLPSMAEAQARYAGPRAGLAGAPRG